MFTQNILILLDMNRVGVRVDHMNGASDVRIKGMNGSKDFQRLLGVGYECADQRFFDQTKLYLLRSGSQVPGRRR